MPRKCKGKGRGEKDPSLTRVRVEGRSRKRERRKVERIRVWLMLIWEQWIQVDLVTNGPGLEFTLGGPLDCSKLMI